MELHATNIPHEAHFVIFFMPEAELYVHVYVCTLISVLRILFLR
jgi:hypothetical protein